MGGSGNEGGGTPPSESGETAGTPKVEENLSETLAELCGDIYENAVNTGTLGDLAVVSAIVERLGAERCV